MSTLGDEVCHFFVCSTTTADMQMQSKKALHDLALLVIVILSVIVLL